MSLRIIRRLAGFVLLASAGTAAQAQDCGHHLFVSGYFSNNVAIHDACSGRFLRQLEHDGRIRGPQAVRLNPVDGLIYVVSEGNDQIQRYRHADGYPFVDVFAQLPAAFDPTGIAFSADGRVLVAGYRSNTVVRLDRASGAVEATVLPANSGARGLDNGTLVGTSGMLYVPGYDSHSVARVNLASGHVDGAFVAPRSGGLRNARGILEDGATLLVSGEGSGSVYRFDAASGALLGTPITGLSRPTGLADAPDGSLLVLSGNRVRRYDRGSGAELQVVTSAAEGGISGGTFVAVMPAPPSSGSVAIGSGFTGTWVDAGASGQLGLGLEVLPGGNLLAEVYAFAPQGGQAWIGGVGPIVGGDHATITMSTIDGPGGRWGAAFDAARVQTTTWGTITLRFDDCNRGTLEWDSDAAGFGSGALAISRVTLPAGLQCP